ncbi:MAG TPA: LCP family protein [Acidimicrobiales bacterium]|nr:LCP family protein [Acidimicrobiales bacterium]
MSAPALPAPPRRRRRLRRTWPQRLVILGTAVLVVLSVGAAWGVWYANHRLEDLERVTITHSDGTVPDSGVGAPGTTAASIPPDLKPGAAQNYLLVGSDARSQACIDPNSPYAGAFGNVTGDRSDTIILVRVDPSASQAAILSFPRDLWVPIAGTGRKAKINSAYDPNVPSRLVQTIEENFGVRVDHYVDVSLCAFKNLVDAIGGVKIPFAYPTRDKYLGGFADAPGCVAFDGDKALAYVRARYYQYETEKGWQDDPTSDYGRIARQQDFLRRALQKAIDKGARSPAVANELINVALKPGNVVVDADLTLNDLLRLASTLRDFDLAQLHDHSYRVEGQGALRGTESVIIPDLDAPTTKSVLEVFRGQAKLSDVPPTTAADSSTTAAEAPASTPPTAAGAAASTGAPTTRVAATGTPLPTVAVAPNPLGITPPDDPTCR